MDLVQVLKQRIIPIVLNQDNNQYSAELFAEKSSAIAAFIPVILSIFKAKPELIGLFQNSLNPRIADIFAHDELTKNHFIDALEQRSDHAETETLLNQSIAPTLGALGDLAGSHDQDLISHYLDQNQDSINSSLPTWATALLGGLGVAAIPTAKQAATSAMPINAMHAAGDDSVHEPLVAPHSATHVSPSVLSEPVKQKAKTSWLLPLIALIILGILISLFLRYCNHKQQTVASTDQTAVNHANAQPAFFQLTTNAAGELASCQARIGNPSFVEGIQQQVKLLFNHPVGCGIDSSQQYHAELTDQNALPSMLKLLKGAPNTSLTWTGDKIVLQAADTVATQGLVDQIKGLAPQLTVTTEHGVDVDQAVKTSISDSEKALASLNHDQVRPLDIATALNLQIINFATGSNDIPELNKAVLDQAAELLNKLPNVALKVKGFTDATGDAESNKQLSQQRAQSVVNYLLSKGVAPSKLTAVGLGQENPIADNATDEGRFKNRRIEFEVSNTETGVKREVAAEKVQVIN